MSRTFHPLSPILLSFLLIMLISLAVNPVTARMRTMTGGRQIMTGVTAGALLVVIGLTGWAFVVPMKASVTKISEQLPIYWERLQKPLIKMEQQAVLSEEKLQAEVTTEIAQEKIAEGGAEAKSTVTKPAPLKTTKDSGSFRSSLGQTRQSVAGSFTSVAFNAAQILLLLVTVFFGTTFTLMNPRPIFGAIFYWYRNVITIRR